MNNLEVYFAENVEVRVRNLMAKAKSQIDYKTLHSDYMTVRNNTILNVILYIIIVPNQRANSSEKSSLRKSSKYFETS